ncbi:hypothetical protein [Streptobacillus felis]|uniref:hypothetical protein n=1 Tax=Streptobacillus felis TaxID=1384509 RepID=UPI00082D315D|nr:hypothetical protein [Streptobacillus felis]
MAIVKIKKMQKPNILFGVVLNNLESNLYNAVSNRKLANEVLKESLNINSRRLIQIVEVVSANDEVLDLLVVYDAIVNEKEEIKLLSSLKVEEFNFHIFNFSRKEKVDIENIIQGFNVYR